MVFAERMNCVAAEREKDGGRAREELINLIDDRHKLFVAFCPPICQLNA